MPFSDHASDDLSSRFAFLDRLARHGTLPYAMWKRFFLFAASLLFSQFLIYAFLELDIESLPFVSRLKLDADNRTVGVVPFFQVAWRSPMPVLNGEVINILWANGA